MRIESIETLSELEPFASQKINFQPCPEGIAEVHLFTGPNGTGKSRLLSAMAGTGIPEKLHLKKSKFGPNLKKITLSEHQQIVCLGNPRTDLLKLQVDEKFAPDAVFTFKGSSVLEATEIDIFSAFETSTLEERLTFSPSRGGATNQRIVESKIQAAMESISATDDPTGRAHPIIQIEEAISELTGQEFAVVTQKRPKLELAFRWGKSRLPITSLPDGLSSVLSWIMDAATSMDHLYPESPNPLSEPAIFFLDEPETHLHPQWQRRILPLAQKIFPGSQFFVATHSPFVISSLNEGFIYQLRKGEDGLVNIAPPQETPKGDSYISTTERFLETGEWFDPESEALLTEFRASRKAALSGDDSANERSISLGQELSQRSQELANIVGPEIVQLERLLETAK